MELKFTKDLLREHESVFLNVGESNINYLLKEIIIIEIILNNTPTTSLEIQNSFENLFNNDKKYLPSYLFKFSDVAQKTKLRIMLNNLISSNQANKVNGLGQRKELRIDKVEKSYTFAPSEELLNYFETNELNNSSMLYFCKEFPYLYRYLYYVNGCKKEIINAKCKCDNSGAFLVFAEKPTREKISLFSPKNLKYVCKDCFVKSLFNEVYRV